MISSSRGAGELGIENSLPASSPPAPKPLLRVVEGFRPTEINVFFNTGGIGDMLCRLPALKILLDTYSAITVHLFYFPFLTPILEHFFSGYKQLKFHPLPDPDTVLRASYYFAAPGDQMHLHTTLGVHLVDYAFHIMLDRVPHNIHERNYLQLDFSRLDAKAPALSPGSYVVLTPGFTAPNRALPGNTWNEIAAGVQARGLTPLWLGKKQVMEGLNGNFDTDVDFSLGVDLRDQTTLIEAARIMRDSLAVVGLDNGLLHLAGMTDAPIVAAYSSVTPALRLPIRKGEVGYNCEVIEPVGCRGCESKIRFAYDVDFRHCYFSDYQCISELTSQRFLAAIDRVHKRTYGSTPNREGIDGNSCVQPCGKSCLGC